MSRLIDADDLLTAFPIDDEPMLTKSCVRMTIRRMPTIEPQRWIPVSERLPECGQNILAWVLDGRDGHMTVARFDDGKAYWSYMNRNYYPKGEIIAWMPLPEQYKERGIRGVGDGSNDKK